jgi:hypothetical protein
MMYKEEKELEGGNYEFIEGEFINVKQSTIRAVEGGHVELQQVGALSIDGDRIEVTQGAAAILRGNDIRMNQSISAVTAADAVSMNFSFSPVSISRDQMSVNRSAVGLMAGKEVNAENSTAFLVLGRKIEGNMTTLIDWRSALALGAVLGGIFGLLSIFNRK